MEFTAFATEKATPHTKSCGKDLEEMSDDEFDVPVLTTKVEEEKTDG